MSTVREIKADAVNHPVIERDLEQLRSMWPQSHAVRSEYGAHLITVPGVILPSGYKQTICTILFVAPPGYPSAVPQDFYTDIDIELNKPSGFGYDFMPHCRGDFSEWNPFAPFATRKWVHDRHVPHPFIEGKEVNLGGGAFPARHWPSWERCMFWSLRLQMWNPNKCTLMTFMNAVRQRVNPAR